MVTPAFEGGGTGLVPSIPLLVPSAVGPFDPNA